MIIIGCDYHPGFQQIAFVDTETGDYGEQRLEHSEGAEKFYRDLAAQGKKVRVGMEASGHARSPPSPHEPSFPVPPDHGRTSPLPRGAAVAALALPRCRYLQTQFAESSGDNRIL